MIALLSPAYFESSQCLEELNAAIEADVKILLVQMEGTTTEKGNQWKGIKANAELQRMDVRRVLSKLNTIPHPGNLQTVPTAFIDVLRIIQGYCKPDAPTHNVLFEHGSSSEQVAKSVQVKAHIAYSSVSCLLASLILCLAFLLCLFFVVCLSSCLVLSSRLVLSSCSCSVGLVLGFEVLLCRNYVL
jgi:hypothetical protein